MRPVVFALPLLAATAAFSQGRPAIPPATSSTPSTQSFIVQKEEAMIGLDKIEARLGSAASCPVGMRAQQAASGQTVWTISREDARQPRNEVARRSGEAGVHVELNAANDKPIHQVELEVYFLAPGARVVPVASAAGQARPLAATAEGSHIGNVEIGPGTEGLDAHNPAKTFELSAEGGAAFKLAGDLLVGPAASITRVRVLRIEYTDRTTWQPGGSAVCSIEPDRFLLVGGR